MRKCFYNSLIAFFGGLFGASILFIVFYLLYEVGGLESPFLHLPFGKFWDILFIAGVLEEGMKFLLIKRNIGQYPYGFILGLGFGTSEAILRYPFWESKAIFQGRIITVSLHIITAGIIAYFIRENKPILGLLVAVFIHTGFDLAVNWAIQ